MNYSESTKKNTHTHISAQSPVHTVRRARKPPTDLVDEDDRGRVSLGVLERLPQVRLRLAGQLAHDLRPVDGEAVGAGLRRYCASDHCLAAPGRSVPSKTVAQQ